VWGDLMNRNKDVIALQVALLREVISKIIPYNTNYALIDFPNHSNVGDSAIWLGEIKMLYQITGRMPSYICTIKEFDENTLQKALPSGPILIHGGGNFGDIWQYHQKFRESILVKFKDRVIIQLPQSIKFNGQSNIDRCRKIISEHSSFHLFVRDKPSLDFARNNFSCSSELLPDFAFALGALKRPSQPVHDIFMLMRTDTERSSIDRSAFDTSEASIADWLGESFTFNATSKVKAAIKSLFSGAWNPQQRRLAHYQQLANGRLQRGLCMLSSGRRVITDRLHAHILSTLLDIPHVALDNNYGKVSGYINVWTKSYPCLDTAITATEALDKLAHLPNN
jgi:exopolysaccharide biosynthesis predicted pyruvyltransferase EpsI